MAAAKTSDAPSMASMSPSKWAHSVYRQPSTRSEYPIALKTSFEGANIAIFPQSPSFVAGHRAYCESAHCCGNCAAGSSNSSATLLRWGMTMMRYNINIKYEGRAHSCPIAATCCPRGGACLRGTEARSTRRGWGTGRPGAVHPVGGCKRVEKTFCVV